MAYVRKDPNIVKPFREQLSIMQGMADTQSLRLSTFTEYDWSWDRERLRLHTIRSAAKLVEILALAEEGHEILDHKVHAVSHPNTTIYANLLVLRRKRVISKAAIHAARERWHVWLKNPARPYCFTAQEYHERYDAEHARRVSKLRAEQDVADGIVRHYPHRKSTARPL